MATFVIKQTRKDSVYVVVTRNNGNSFGQTIQADQLEDGDLDSLLRQIKAIVRNTVQGQKKNPNLKNLDPKLDQQQDDAAEVVPPT